MKNLWYDIDNPIKTHQSNRKYGKGDPNEKSQIQTMLQ